MNRAEANRANPNRRPHPLLLFLLRLVTIACTLLVVIPYFQIDLFNSLQIIAGQQILRILLLLVIVLQAGHWLLAERRGAFIVSATLFVVLLIELSHTVPFRGSEPDTPPTLRVMTFNSQGQTVPGWISWMDQENVDLACVQEVRPGDIETIQGFGRLHGFSDLHVTFTSDSSDGIALLSRLPFLHVTSVDVAEHNGKRRVLPLVHVNANGTRIQVLGVHLASTPRSDNLEGLGEAWEVRELQVESLKAWVESVDMNLIVLGDFNATPTDGLIRKLRGPLDDMWMNGGTGVGGTWPAGLPFLRIDMVMARGFEGMSGSEIKSIGASDHMSLTMTLYAKD